MLNRIYDLILDHRKKFKYCGHQNISKTEYLYQHNYVYRYRNIKMILSQSGNIDGIKYDDELYIEIENYEFLSFTPNYELIFMRPSKVIEKGTVKYEGFYKELKKILESDEGVL